MAARATRTLAAIVGVVLSASMAHGQMQIQNGCMEETSGDGTLQCTAADVRISDVTNVAVLDDGCAFPGDTVTFTATWRVVTGAQERYDIGLYFATDGDPDGDGAEGGQCSINTLPLFAPGGDNNETDIPGDTCGDTDAGTTATPSVTLTVTCVDTNGDGKLDVPACTSWDNNDRGLCDSPLDAFPSTGSKCNCTSITVADILVPPVTLDVQKDASPITVNESGGAVTFSVSVTNPSSFVTVTLNSLTDSIFGNITQVQGDITSTTCTVPQLLAMNGGTYSCEFVANVSGPPGTETDTVTAVGTDSHGRPVSGMDDATVTIEDVGSQILLEKVANPVEVLEPGGDVEFTFTIWNQSGDLTR
jgi:hypothetical protein